MPRIRTIKPRFWDSNQIAKLSLQARLTYIGLWNYSDDLGVISADPMWIRSKLFPYDDITISQIEIWLNELVNYQFMKLILYRDQPYYYIPGFLRHQLINRPNYDDANIPKELLDSLLVPASDESLINHAIIIDPSVPINERIGREEEEKERKGKEGIIPPYIPPEGECVLSEYQKFSLWVRKAAPNAALVPHQITDGEFNRIRQKYTPEQIQEVISQIDNFKGTARRYNNLYRTFLNWARRIYG